MGYDGDRHEGYSKGGYRYGNDNYNAGARERRRWDEGQAAQQRADAAARAAANARQTYTAPPVPQGAAWVSPPAPGKSGSRIAARKTVQVGSAVGSTSSTSLTEMGEPASISSLVITLATIGAVGAALYAWAVLGLSVPRILVWTAGAAVVGAIGGFVLWLVGQLIRILVLVVVWLLKAALIAAAICAAGWFVIQMLR